MRFALPVLVATLAACASPGAPVPRKPPLAPVPAPTELPSPAPRDDAPAVLIRGATVMTAAGAIHSPGHVLMRAGVIEAVGDGDGVAPQEARVVEAKGAFVTPGIIDTHSHIGVFPQPHVEAHSDGNEMTSPVTAEVWAEHGFWPQDPAIARAWTGGVTTIQVLPGSANLIGGRSFVARLVPAVSAREMRFPGAPQGLKLACGENPKRVYGDRRSAPMTRMGNAAGWRSAFQRAREYQRKWAKYERDLAHWEQRRPDEDPPEPPDRNLQLETLVQVLDGRVLVHWHCYRADEMAQVLDVAQEFGFQVRSFHHAVEAYKLASRLADEGVAVSTWSDWFGFKMEALDGVPQNAALVAASGARAIIHSDSATEIRRLNQEAAKAQASGRAIGLSIDDDQALRWITAHPAWALGIDSQVGTLEPGKRADVVVWDRHPFSVYARATQVFVDGHVVFDRALGRRLTDFELGYTDAEVSR